ncbi:hypothetical protein LCGC14_1506540, partial [marine sediment metagenome]
VFVWADRLKRDVSDPHIYDTPERRLLRERLVSDLENIVAMEGEVKASKEFMALWIPWYEKESKESGVHGKAFDGYNSRRGAHLIKLSMIRSTSQKDGRFRLGKNDFLWAKNTLEQVEQWMPRAMSHISRDELESVRLDVMSIIRDEGEVTLTDMCKEFVGDVTVDEMQNRILKALVRIGFCEQSRVGKDFTYIYNEDKAPRRMRG